MSATVTLAPLVSWPMLGLLGGLSLLVLVLGFARRARAMWLRAIVIGLILLALANPQAARESGDIRPDVALLLIDDSRSQQVGERPAQTEAAVKGLRERLARLRNVEVREVRYDGAEDADEAGTRLSRALDDALAEIPSDRFGGAFLITDGQVADVPATVPALSGPVHAILTGGPDETDRRLAVEKIPGYGIVGKTLQVDFRVEDNPSPMPPGKAGDRVGVRLSIDGEVVARTQVLPGETGRLEFSLDHAGASIVELEADVTPGELSAGNNRAAVRVNGVRDRFRVLLVSGQPHAGERVWRNLLKSDPAVDMVHFTILRPPEKDDFTPLRELSLIVFPIEKLFVKKLHEFDLIVFDRYVVRDVLPPSYFRNIAEYVRGGGALLAAVGPEYAGLRSLFQTPLGEVLPAQPTQKVHEGGFRPRVSAAGRLHPVTAHLPLNGDETPRWGRWFRYIETGVISGDVLMTAPDEAPLLVLERVAEGRVAQLASDHIWLWARGFEGGGPQAELLRRLAHWLVREPDLEEERLIARVVDGELRVERRSLNPRPVSARVTTPTGASVEVTLQPGADGVARGSIDAAERGLYRIEAADMRAFAAAGALNPIELADLHQGHQQHAGQQRQQGQRRDQARFVAHHAGPAAARAVAVRPHPAHVGQAVAQPRDAAAAGRRQRRQQPVAGAQVGQFDRVQRPGGGGISWLRDGLPDVRRVRPDRDRSGRGWAGVVRHESRLVTALTLLPLLPGVLLMTLVLGGLMLTWWREGR